MGWENGKGGADMRQDAAPEVISVGGEFACHLTCYRSSGKIAGITVPIWRSEPSFRPQVFHDGECHFVI